jgi:Transglutaminase-like superfamily
MTLRGLPPGGAGTAATLRQMRALARDGAKDSGVLEVAGDLVRYLPQYDRVAEVIAIHAFVRDAIRYTSDPLDLELIRTPKAILEKRVGDCDDKSTLLACLLRCIGHPSRFVAIAMQPDPQSYSHVYVETPLGKRWIALETIKPVDAGWSPSNVTRRMVVHI